MADCFNIRFHWMEISFYLRNQLDGKRQQIPVLNIYDVQPWEGTLSNGFTSHLTSHQDKRGKLGQAEAEAELTELRLVDIGRRQMAKPCAVTTTPMLRHQFSFCRVYVVSGSFRTFDRRPLEPVSRGTQVRDNRTATSFERASMMENTTSPPCASHSSVSDPPEASEDDIWDNLA
ncbi:hypothetical protein V6N11_069723 [Hibiscus sabdariffa]|uniref:Uncharacterized protein n=1 Tax=Hibiscus sabdariffa TaxID=183260 RepID=A0ABR2Q478_9ROSI